MVIKKLFLLAALPFTLCALDKAALEANIKAKGPECVSTHDYYRSDEREQLETLTDQATRRKIQVRAYARLHRARRKVERRMLYYHIDDNELPDVQAPTVDNNLLDTHVHVDDYYKTEELEQLKALTDRTLRKRIQNRAAQRSARNRKRIELASLTTHLTVSIEIDKVNWCDFLTPYEQRELLQLTDSALDKHRRSQIHTCAYARAARARKKAKIERLRNIVSGTSLQHDLE